MRIMNAMMVGVLMIAVSTLMATRSDPADADPKKPTKLKVCVPDKAFKIQLESCQTCILVVVDDELHRRDGLPVAPHTPVDVAQCGICLEPPRRSVLVR